MKKIKDGSEVATFSFVALVIALGVLYLSSLNFERKPVVQYTVSGVVNDSGRTFIDINGAFHPIDMKKLKGNQTIMIARQGEQPMPMALDKDGYYYGNFFMLRFFPIVDSDTKEISTNVCLYLDSKLLEKKGSVPVIHYSKSRQCKPYSGDTLNFDLSGFGLKENQEAHFKIKFSKEADAFVKKLWK